MKYKAVIFDMDGTVLDTLEDLKNSVNYGLKANNLPERTMDEIRRFVGNGVKRLIELAIPENSTRELYDSVLNAFKAHYAVHCKDNTKPYGKIAELIDEINRRGYKTAIVSNKSDEGVKALCEEFFKGKFSVSIGQRDSIRRKPYPDEVFEAMKSLSVTKEETVYIGDSEVDVLTAKNAQVDVISVLWGFRDKAFLLENGGEVFVNEPMEILDLI